MDETLQLDIEIANSTNLDEIAQKTLKRQNLIKESWDLRRKIDELEGIKLLVGQPVFNLRDVEWTDTMIMIKRNLLK